MTPCVPKAGFTSDERPRRLPFDSSSAVARVVQMPPSMVMSVSSGRSAGTGFVFKVMMFSLRTMQVLVPGLSRISVPHPQ